MELINHIVLTHLKYKIKQIRSYDWFSVLDSWRFNAIDFSVQPHKSYHILINGYRGSFPSPQQASGVFDWN